MKKFFLGIPFSVLLYGCALNNENNFIDNESHQGESIIKKNDITNNVRSIKTFGFYGESKESYEERDDSEYTLEYILNESLLNNDDVGGIKLSLLKENNLYNPYGEYDIKVVLSKISFNNNQILFKSNYKIYKENELIETIEAKNGLVPFNKDQSIVFNNNREHFFNEFRGLYKNNFYSFLFKLD